MDLDQLQRPGPGFRARRIDRGMRGLNKRRLAHPARAPQQRIVGGQALREPLGVVEQNVADAVDAAQKSHLDAVDLVNRLEAAAVGMPHEGVAGLKFVAGRSGRGQALQRVGDAVEQREQVGIGFGQGQILWQPGRRRYHGGREPRNPRRHCPLTGHRVPIGLPHDSTI